MKKTNKWMGLASLVLVLCTATATTATAQSITNPSFEDGTTGWTVSKMQTQTNDGMSTYKAGNTYLERWIAAPGLLGCASVKQTVTGLSNGVYRLTVAAMNVSQNATSTQNVGAWIVGNGLRTAVTTLNTYTLDFFVTDGTAEIGFVCDGASGNWVGCDNFTLTYRGNTNTYIQSAGNTVKNYANSLINTYGSDTQYSNLVSTLTSAINGGNLTTVANAAKAVVAGERAYRLRHPSGSAPTVTWNKRHARGSIWIFGRVSWTGSNVVEEGFCYGTSPNPTLETASYTTDWIDSYGKAIWMQDLTPGTMYYIRPYAMTKTGAVGYGEVLKVPTLPQGDIHWSVRDSGDETADNHIRSSCEWAFDRFWDNLTQLTTYWPSIGHVSGVPTAECSRGGWCSVGDSWSYQNPGTIMHEMLHGVGVGQHWMWGDFTRDQYPVWDALRFWNNDENATLSGDGMHLWPYGINGAHEDNGSDQLYIGNALVCEALGEGGLPLTDSQWLLPYYAFVQDDNTKYYIKCEDKNRGLLTSYLVVDNSGNLKWQEMTATQAQGNDKAAWYITFDASIQKYHIKNASTNKYICYSSADANNGFTTSNTATDIQMKKCRVDVNVGSQTYQGYYFLDFASGQAMEAKTDGAVGSIGFRIWDDASLQRWVILAAGSDMETFESGVVDIQKGILQHYINGYATAKNVNHTDKTSGATTVLTNTINTINSAISGSVTLDQVNQYISDIKSAGLTFLNNTKPAENAYYDLTFLIENPDFTDSADGWSLDPTRNYGAVEFYQTTFDLYQILPDMPAGTYRFTADAFQRPGANADVYTAYQGGTDNVNAVIYVNNSSQKIKNVMSAQQNSSLSSGEYETTDGTFVPNGMESGSYYLNHNKYNNYLEGEFAAGNLRIGLRGTVSNNSYWTMADNFKLYYMGADGVVLSLKEQLEANGFTKITALPADYSPYFFVLYDHDQDLTMVLKTPNHQGGSKSMWYDADVNPMTSKEPLWTMDSYTQDDTEYQVLANATYPDYMLQTENNAAFNYRCSDNGGNGNLGWGRTKYEYLSAGYWTIQSGVYPQYGYLGPWEGTISDDAETALNKTASNEIGHFDVFTIHRGDYVKRFDAWNDTEYDHPLNITYVLENPGGERRTTIGWKNTGAVWQGQGNNIPTGKVDNYYLESYNGNGIGNSDLYQEIQGLPDGYYRFSARALVRDGGDQGFKIYANSESTKVTASDFSTRFNVIVQVLDGNLRVGAKAENVTKDWIAIDDAKLEYLGLSIPGYNVGTPELSIVDNSYIQELETVTFNFSEANSNVEGAVFTIVDNTKKASLYKGNTKVGDYILYISGKTVSANFDGTTLDADATYRIDLPAGAVGYAGQATNEAVSVTFKTPVVFDGTYYLYNTYTNQYLSRGGTWATACILDDWGLAMIVATNAEGKTTLKYFDSQAYLFKDGTNGNCWGDGGTGAQFIVSKTGTNYKFLNNGIGYLAVNSGRAVTDAIEGNNLVGTSNVWTLESTAAHVANYTACANAQAATAASAASISNVTTKAALDNYLTTSTGTVDVAITGAKAEKFNVYATQTETLTEAEYYKETVEGLTPGLYRLSVDAFQRAGGFDDVAAADGARGCIYVYANEAKTQIKSVMEYGSPTSYANTDYQSGGLYYPNRENPGYAALNTGNYQNVVYVYVPADAGETTGTLTFGINNPNRMGNGISRGVWAVFENFRLERVVSGITLNETDATVPPRATHVNVTLNRKITADTWNTICFPFDMTSEQIKATFGNSTVVKQLSSAETNGESTALSFTTVDAIAANTPYLLKTDQAGEQYTISSVSIAPSDDLTQTVDGIQFIGNYIYPTVLSNTDGIDYYIKSNKFYSSPGGTKLKGFRAYFHVPTSSGVKALSSDFDDIVTGLETMNNEQFTMDNAEVYDLQGRRVSTPAHGMYIVNGKKVYIK